MLRLDDPDSAQHSKLFLSLNLARVDFNDIDEVPQGASGVYTDQGVQFYQLTALFDDFSVAQTMLCTLSHDSDGSDSSFLEEVKPTSWSIVVKSRMLPSEHLVDNYEDDFVKPDGPIYSKEPQSNPEFQQLIRHTTGNDGLSRDIFNFTELYDAISSYNLDPLRHPSSLPESIDVLSLVEEIEWRLNREENVEPFTLGTLQEYAETTATVEDIEDASTKLQGLFSADDYASSLEPCMIASDRILGISGQAVTACSLSSVYDLVLQSWLASLPGSISARIRQSKERSVRGLTAGLLLASTRIRKANDRGKAQFRDLGTILDLAIDHSSPPHSSSQADAHYLSSQPCDPISLDTPRVSSTASSSPLARLSKHLHMNDTPLEIPPSIKQVISHWQLQTDPSAYNWEATEQAFAEDLELEQEGMPKKRERARRKKERQAKRQRRENELFTGRIDPGKIESQPQLLRSSPGPAVPAASSQPAPQQSQMFVVQSQVEPGKHGGRPSKKKKVKSRMSGF